MADLSKKNMRNTCGNMMKTDDLSKKNEIEARTQHMQHEDWRNESGGR